MLLRRRTIGNQRISLYHNRIHKDYEIVISENGVIVLSYGSPDWETAKENYNETSDWMKNRPN